ncbi:hypothetical protein, partial [uncultured Lactobacillus sp.]|uniref:hypothetical protein n=1 Tax=uncultured Lactobacillus sp. TaxID=153152 RepID=UPI0025D37777
FSEIIEHSKTVIKAINIQLTFKVMHKIDPKLIAIMPYKTIFPALYWLMNFLMRVTLKTIT